MNPQGWKIPSGMNSIPIGANVYIFQALEEVSIQNG